MPSDAATRRSFRKSRSRRQLRQRRVRIGAQVLAGLAPHGEGGGPALNDGGIDLLADVEKGAHFLKQGAMRFLVARPQPIIGAMDQIAGQRQSAHLTRITIFRVPEFKVAEAESDAAYDY
jgi:hypothetical protein